MDKYKAMPNSEDTWLQIRREASDILWKYFYAGKLMGTKPQEAFL